jgi:hypothetical protein
MSLSVVAQLVSAATNALFVVVIAVGYFLMIRLYRQMVKVYDRMLGLMEAQSTAMGRPLVVVYEDPAKLPNVNLVVHNVGTGPAKRVEFEFSTTRRKAHRKLQRLVALGVAHLKKGIDGLAPGAKITCYWDTLDNLLSKRRDQGYTDNTEVITRYSDLAGHSYETRWEIEPSIYEGIDNLHYKDMNDLVEAVERILEERIDKADGQHYERGKHNQGGGGSTG